MWYLSCIYAARGKTDLTFLGCLLQMGTDHQVQNFARKCRYLAKLCAPLEGESSIKARNSIFPYFRRAGSWDGHHPISLCLLHPTRDKSSCAVQSCQDSIYFSLIVSERHLLPYQKWRQQIVWNGFKQLENLAESRNDLNISRFALRQRGSNGPVSMIDCSNGKIWNYICEKYQIVFVGLYMKLSLWKYEIVWMIDCSNWKIHLWDISDYIC